MLLLGALVLACSQGVGATGHQTPVATDGPSAPPTSSAGLASPSASHSPTPLPSNTLVVGSAAQAAALVFESNPEFASVWPDDKYLAGETAWYEAVDDGDHFSVMVTLGKGDCPAGCIYRHTWTYEVTRGGKVALVSDEGDVVEPPAFNGGDKTATVDVQLVSGPTCPVERNPPDPSCAPRPVSAITVVVRDPGGAQIATQASDAAGKATFHLPAGAYYVEAGAAPGMMGQAEPLAFSVPADGYVPLTFRYDTGIR